MAVWQSDSGGSKKWRKQLRIQGQQQQFMSGKPSAHTHTPLTVRLTLIKKGTLTAFAAD